MKRYKQWFLNSKGYPISFFGTLEAGAKVLGAENLIFVEI